MLAFAGFLFRNRKTRPKMAGQSPTHMPITITDSSYPASSTWEVEVARARVPASQFLINSAVFRNSHQLTVL